MVIAVVGWAGAALLLGAYALVSAGRLAGGGLTFQLMNLGGAAGLAINSAVNGAWPSVALNLVWIAVRRRDPRCAGRWAAPGRCPVSSEGARDQVS